MVNLIPEVFKSTIKGLSFSAEIHQALMSQFSLLALFFTGNYGYVLTLMNFIPDDISDTRWLSSL